MINFPEHDCALHLVHNEHKSYYQTVAEWIADCESRDFYWDWVSDEQKAKAIAANDCWTLQWYPRTPIGSHCLAACDLEVLLEAARNWSAPI